MEFPVITLCGSTKYKEAFEKLSLKLSLQGVVVLSLPVFSQHDNIKLTEDNINTLKEIQKQKIDMSAGIIVITKYGHIGDNTKKEIEYAESKNKIIMYYYIE